MKPLEIGRRSLNWLGIHFVDDNPVGQKLKLAQKASAVIYAALFISICSLHVITFFSVDTINPEEFFFVLLQFVITAHGSSAFITVYFYGSRISIVFQSLAEIYKECKRNESVLNRKTTISNPIEFFFQTPMSNYPPSIRNLNGFMSNFIKPCTIGLSCLE